MVTVCSLCEPVDRIEVFFYLLCYLFFCTPSLIAILVVLINHLESSPLGILLGDQSATLCQCYHGHSALEASALVFSISYKDYHSTTLCQCYDVILHQKSQYLSYGLYYYYLHNLTCAWTGTRQSDLLLSFLKSHFQLLKVSQ